MDTSLRAGELLVLLFPLRALLVVVEALDLVFRSPSMSGLPLSGAVRSTPNYLVKDRTDGDFLLPAENIFLTGSVDALKNWSPDNAIALNPANYPIWSGTSLDSSIPFRL